MSNSFTNQVIAQMEMFARPRSSTAKEVYILPKHLDEKVARLHLAALGVDLTELTPDQSPTSASRSTAPTSPTTTATRGSGRRYGRRRPRVLSPIGAPPREIPRSSPPAGGGSVGDL